MLFMLKWIMKKKKKKKKLVIMSPLFISGYISYGKIYIRNNLLSAGTRKTAFLIFLNHA